MSNVQNQYCKNHQCFYHFLLLSSCFYISLCFPRVSYIWSNANASFFLMFLHNLSPVLKRFFPSNLINYLRPKMFLLTPCASSLPLTKISSWKMHFYAFYGLNTTAVEDTSLFIIPFYIHIKPAIKLIVQQIKPWIFCMLISKNITSMHYFQIL